MGINGGVVQLNGYIMSTLGNKLGIFVGSSRHNLDGKFRVTVPSKWRIKDAQYLGMPNPEGCINVCPPKMIGQIQERMSEISQADPHMQRVFGEIFSQSEEYSFDKQGRIGLNERLRTHSGITKDVILIGYLNYFQIWDFENYEKWLKNTKEKPMKLSPDMEKIRKTMIKLVI